MKRADFLAAVAALNGTPFHHQGRTAHGIDCIGLVVVAAASAGAALPDRRDYGPQPDPAVLLASVREACDEIPIGEERPGDLAVFCFDRHGTPQHFGVVLPDARMIHTTSKIGCVRIEPLDTMWQRRLHSFWRLREMED